MTRPWLDTPEARRGADRLVRAFRWGFERETQRVLSDGRLSPSPHPPGLRGPGFTRDFAESQLEIVTGTHATWGAALAELEQLTATAQRALGDELLWPLSMPPRLPEDTQIPIAVFGSDELGRRAALYRKGLALRYGSARQMICGLHVNVSLAAPSISWLRREAPLTAEERLAARPRDAYALRLARNLYSDLPLLVIFYGVSPVPGADTRGQPFAVSYRNSRYGYARHEFLPYLDLESVPAYVAALRRGLRTVSGNHARLGLVRDGRVLQLNPNVLQTEKEFYAPIRLRQTALPGRSALQALEQQGIAYLELRFFDIDPLQRAGIGADALRFLHLLLLDDVTRSSAPRTNAALRHDIEVAGELALRAPEQLAGEPLLTSASARLAALTRWARRLDGRAPHRPYQATLALFRRRLALPSTLPSASLARRLAVGGLDWTAFGLSLARALTRDEQGVPHALAHAGL